MSSNSQKQQQQELQKLKLQVKGSSPNIFVITTHHARIICFFNKLRKLAGSNTEEKLAVRNLAVIKFTYIPGESIVIVELVCEGILNNKGHDKQWTTSQNKFYIFKLTEHNSSLIFPGYMKTSIPVILYMVRHGLGLHNKKANLFKLDFNLLKLITSDPLLINDHGIAVAARAMKDDISQYNTQSVYLVSSPLRRCIETMALLVLEWKNAAQEPQKKSQKAVIYILPCLHELPAKDKKSHGQCDNDSNALQSNSRNRWFRWLHPENTSICISHTDSCKRLTDIFKGMKKGDLLQKLQSQSQSISIDWSIYNINKKLTGGDCKTQVFSECLNILGITEAKTFDI
jgi:broad specificity phosphatase PhoE